MDDTVIGIIGMIAGVCTTSSFIPQIIKIIRSKHARDISLCMYIVLTAGIFLWIVYGVFLEALPVVVANVIAFSLCLFVIFMKIKYRDKD